MAVGLKQVLSALDFLHTSSLIHGALCRDAIFVDQAGNWKLWALDLLSDVSTPEGLSFFKQHDQLLTQMSGSVDARSPERRAQDWTKLTKAPAAVDIWSFSMLLLELYDRDPPAALAKLQKRTSTTTPQSRGRASQILKTSLFTTHPIVTAMDDIENINMSLKEHGEVLKFLLSLSQPSALEGFPPKAKQYRLVPVLKLCLERCSAADRRPEETRDVVSAVLPLLLEVLPPRPRPPPLLPAADSPC